jgi:hypothetical protein
MAVEKIITHTFENIDDFLKAVSDFCKKKGIVIREGEYLECCLEKYLDVDFKAYTGPHGWVITLCIGDFQQVFKLTNLIGIQVSLHSRESKGFKIKVLEGKVIIDLGERNG